ncbi:MAG: amino acid adenylation domain-containing protein [Desulfovibrionaceae bacterium]|nr:amino acid adenylation domain-containing protein [Desulfovibrionaceae bacterium]
MYHTNITQYLDENAAMHSDRIAVIDGTIHLSFMELRERALRLAAVIADYCPEGRHVVAVYLPKGIQSVIADVAVMYSGNAYMNMDIHCPELRNRNILTQVRPSIVITSMTLTQKLVPFTEANIPVLCVEETPSFLKPEKAQMLLRRRDACLDTDLLCIINTSGSTGTPKGVALTHRGFMDMVMSAEQVGILDDSPKVMASLSPYVFDIYVFELCLVLMRRATLLVIPENMAAFPVRMLELMNLHRVTWLFWVPTIMVNIANMDLLSEITLSDLRMVWFAGEVFPTAKCNYWRRHLPQARFVNLYGPIEISLDCAFFEVDRDFSDNEPLPIGHAFPNKEIILLDENNRQAAPGQEGEICVRGIGVAPGYYNDPEKTVAAFVQDPRNTTYPDKLYRTGDIGIINDRGELMFEGRRDTLIKHNGYRIELGEIEHIVISAHLVSNCCVLYNHFEKKIVFVYEKPEPISEKELRAQISHLLPRYMVPTIYVHVKEMPRNANGKIDRLALVQNASE